jgi:hypothetical protein
MPLGLDCDKLWVIEGVYFSMAVGAEELALLCLLYEAFPSVLEA